MRSILSSALLTPVLLVSLGACQTLDPAKVCSADWIEPRAKSAVKQVKNSAGGVLQRLEKTAVNLSEGKTPSPFQMFALASSLKSFEKKLTRGKGMKTLRTLAKTCDDPQIITSSLKSVMLDQGLSPNFITFIERQPQYQRLITEQFAPTTSGGAR